MLRWMKKIRCQSLVWPLAVLGVTFLIFMSTQAASYRQCVADRETPHPQNKKYDFSEHVTTFIVCEGVAIDANGNLLTALATIAVAAFTGTLWWASAGQYDLLKKQTEFARQQVAIQGRQTDIQEKQHAVGRLQFLAEYPPRLRVRHVSVHDSGEIVGQPGMFDHNTKVTGGLVVVNAGATKAKIAESRYRIFCSRTGLPAAAPYDTTFHNLLLVGQILDVGESCAIPIADDIVLTPPPMGVDRVMRQFVNERWSLYVMGQIRYEDEGGHERFMGFCRIWRPDGKFAAVNDPDYEYED